MVDIRTAITSERAQPGPSASPVSFVSHGRGVGHTLLTAGIHGDDVAMMKVQDVPRLFLDFLMSTDQKDLSYSCAQTCALLIGPLKNEALCISFNKEVSTKNSVLRHRCYLTFDACFVNAVKSGSLHSST